MTHGYFTGQAASSSDDFGNKIASTLLTTFGQAASQLAQEGAKQISAAVDPKVALANQVAILGPKYGVAPQALKVTGIIPGSIVSGNISVGQSLVERYRAGKTSLNPTLANRATYGSDTITGQCVLSDGSILPIAGWNDDGTVYCVTPQGQKVDATGHVTKGWGSDPWNSPFNAVGQCIDPHDGSVVPIYNWDQFGNVICIDPHDGKKIDAQGHVVTSGSFVGQCVLPDGSILPIAGWDEAGNVYCMTPKGQKVDATGHVITGFQSSGPMFDYRFYQG